jgi:hypothetical protein
VLVSAPTGSGKTLAFSLPVILDVLKMQKKKALASPRLRAVVLEPTRELAKQVLIPFLHILCCLPTYLQTYVEFLKFTEGMPIKCALMDSDHSPSKMGKYGMIKSLQFVLMNMIIFRCSGFDTQPTSIRVK